MKIPAHKVRQSDIVLIRLYRSNDKNFTDALRITILTCSSSYVYCVSSAVTRLNIFDFEKNFHLFAFSIKF